MFAPAAPASGGRLVVRRGNQSLPPAPTGQNPGAVTSAGDDFIQREAAPLRPCRAENLPAESALDSGSAPVIHRTVCGGQGALQLFPPPTGRRQKPGRA